MHTRRIYTVSVYLLVTACPVQQAWEDFYEHHGPEHEASSAGSSGGSTTSAGSTSDTSAGTTGTTGTTGSSSAGETSSGSSSSSSGAAAETGSTGQPTAACGNGVREVGEECDDGDADDEDDCTLACVRPRTIFVTSETYHGGEFDGLEGADTRCRSMALKARLPDALNYKALLSDAEVDARDRLYASPGPYRLVNGLRVADSFAALINEPLLHPVDTTELGTKAYPGVWTGTVLGGTAAPGEVHCEGWHSNSFLDHGSYGETMYVGAEWLYVENPVVNPTDCAALLGLYCLEQE